MLCMAEPEQLEVEVVYAAPERLYRVTLRLEPGATLGRAVSASGLLERCAELDPERWGMGVFGRPQGADWLLQPGDRVELYRPLVIDPKEARRRRVGRLSSGTQRRSG